MQWFIGELDISIGWLWSWDWRNLGEWNFLLGPQVNVCHRNIEINVGFIFCVFWVDLDW